MQKLSEIEEKLNKYYITIKNRYVRLKRCKYALLIYKNNIVISKYRIIFFKSFNDNCIGNDPDN